MDEVIKTLDYYLSIPLKKLETSNFIAAFDMTFDMKLGLYYLMEIYGLSFYSCTHGDWTWFHLCKTENSEYLTADSIRALEMDMGKYNKFDSDVRNGILPEGAQANKPKKEYQPFGFVSPTGEFTPGDWGTHESEAFKIIEAKGFYNEYYQADDTLRLARDFLCEVKGYVLIHNPVNDGGYIVTHHKALTRKQREFLYEYFCDIGDKLRGEYYLREDESN